MLPLIVRKLWGLTAQMDRSPQGFKAEEVWTPKYVASLAKNISDRYKYMPIIGRADQWLKDCKNVLDVGCGWMPYTPDARYTGVDVSEAMLVKARETHPEIKYIQASVFDLPFEDNYFEGVRSSGMLRHIKEWRLALREMLRVCSKKLVFSHLVGGKESQCGRYQWCTTLGNIQQELTDFSRVSPVEPQIWVVKSWAGFESVLFKVVLDD
tara:strand:+ start:13959 stop:14588 length:630 start_codon:yes stop_codon:yes gene_type:complete